MGSTSGVDIGVWKCKGSGGGEGVREMEAGVGEGEEEVWGTLGEGFRGYMLVVWGRFSRYFDISRIVNGKSGGGEGRRGGSFRIYSLLRGLCYLWVWRVLREVIHVAHSP